MLFPVFMLLLICTQTISTLFQTKIKTSPCFGRLKTHYLFLSTLENLILTVTISHITYAYIEG